jgi:hypothetical protein
MELDHTQLGARSGDINIVTVEEFERRKDRFRRATREYYEQAEREFRCLQGFCSRGDSCNYRGKKRIAGKGNDGAVPVPVVAPRKNSLKRCRRRRSSSRTTEVIHCHKPELEMEMELATNLLESHFKIVESSIEEYLVAITSLIRWRHDQPRQRDRNIGSSSASAFHNYRERVWNYHYHQNQNQNHSMGGSGMAGNNGEEFLLQVPLPLPFDHKHQEYGECMQSRLHRHHAEVVEEKHMAMVSVMLAVRETKLTEELAKKIQNGVDAIQNALRKILALIKANRDSTFYYYRYIHCHHRPGFGDAATSGTTSSSTSTNATFTTPFLTGIDHIESAVANQQHESSTAPWNRTVVEAWKLDGYYRWFRANNGVLLIGKNSDNNTRRISSSSSRIESRNNYDEYETEVDANRQGKRLRKEQSIDSIMSING